MSFSNLFFTLQQEGFIIRSCICTGLTEIRNANIGQKGRYYTAFFQLSIGMERFLKLAIILDYMVSHNLSPPGQITVMKFKHDIETLYKQVKIIAQKRGFHFVNQFTIPPISKRILDFLSMFAKGARYANLDSLASGAVLKGPLEDWHDILIDIINSSIPNKKLKRLKEKAQALSKEVSDVIMVRTHDLTNKLLLNQYWLVQPQLYSLSAKYAIWHIFHLFVPLKDLVCALSDEAKCINLEQEKGIAHIPYMNDFFDFLWADRATVMRKKRWP